MFFYINIINFLFLIILKTIKKYLKNFLKKAIFENFKNKKKLFLEN